jgi:DNA polymerase III alpha subunit
MMAAFAGYGFPKAHSASYAEIAWRSAWCKTHYPAEFMAAVLANWGGYYGQSAYLLEARRMGLSLRPPHVNYSRAQFSVSYIDGEPQLFMGLDQLRDLTRDTQKRIMRLRPFDSLSDFLTRVYPRKGEARNLIEVGALDGMGSIPTLLSQLEKGTWRKSQMPLFDTEMDPQADWPAERKAEAQERLLGLSLVGHPLEAYAQEMKAAGVVGTLEAVGKLGELVRVAGQRQTWPRRHSSGGRTIYSMDLGDLEGTIRVLIEDEVYRRGRAALAGKAPVLVEGRVEQPREGAEPVLRVSEIRRLGTLRPPGRASRDARPAAPPGLQPG